MSSFDFAVNDSTSNDSTTTEDTEETPDFEVNEVGSLYVTAAQDKRLQDQFLNHLDLDALKVYNDQTLEDIEDLLEEHSEAHPQQKRHLVSVLFKSTAGKMQRDNDHSIGFVDGKIPESHDEVKGDFSYALWQEDSDVITTEDLDGGEREALEEMGVDLEEVSIKPNSDTVELLSVNGERVPIAVEEGTEVMDTLTLLQQVPDEPSTWTEDGYVESSDPSVFDSSDTEKVAEDDEEVFNLAANPERVNEVNVSDLRGQGPDELSVTTIDNLRAIQTMLRVEQEEDTRKGAVERLEERRNALQGDDEEDEEVEAEEDTDDEDGLSDAEMNLASTLISTGEAEDMAEAKQQIRSL